MKKNNARHASLMLSGPSEDGSSHFDVRLPLKLTYEWDGNAYVETWALAARLTNWDVQNDYVPDWYEQDDTEQDDTKQEQESEEAPEPGKGRLVFTKAKLLPDDGEASEQIKWEYSWQFFPKNAKKGFEVQGWISTEETHVSEYIGANGLEFH